MLFRCQQSVPRHEDAAVTGTCPEPQRASGGAVTRQFELLTGELLEITGESTSQRKMLLRLPVSGKTTRVKKEQEMRKNQLLSERREG